MALFKGKRGAENLQLFQRLRDCAARELRATTDQRAASCAVRDTLIEARQLGMSYRQLSAALVPDDGDRRQVRRARAQVEANLRGRAFDTRCSSVPRPTKDVLRSDLSDRTDG